MHETHEVKMVEREAKGGRHLKWYERQWGSGFLFGVQVGMEVGIGIAIPIAFVAKWLVEMWAR